MVNNRIILFIPRYYALRFCNQGSINSEKNHIFDSILWISCAEKKIWFWIFMWPIVYTIIMIQAGLKGKIKCRCFSE